MTIALRRNRTSLQMNVTLQPGRDLERLGLLPADIVSVTLPEYGFDAARFMVSSIGVNEDFSVSAILDEDATGAYADNLMLPPIMARNIGLPGPRSVPSVDNLVLDEIAVIQQDGTVTLNLITTYDAAEVDRTEFQVRVLGETDFEPGSTIGARWLYPGIIADTTYEVRARHISFLGHAGAWSDWVARLIGGDITPPEDAAGLALTTLPGGYRADWTASVAADYLHTEIWQNLGTGGFANATLIATASGTSFERGGFDTVTQVHVWIRHVDRSKNPWRHGKCHAGHGRAAHVGN